MNLTIEHNIFIYFGVMTVLVLIVSFCLSYWCLKGKEKGDLKKIGVVKEMVEKMMEMFKCCFVLNVGYRLRESEQKVRTCSCDISKNIFFCNKITNHQTLKNCLYQPPVQFCINLVIMVYADSSIKKKCTRICAT